MVCQVSNTSHIGNRASTPSRLQGPMLWLSARSRAGYRRAVGHPEVRGRPVAELRPASRTHAEYPGQLELAKGTVIVAGDIVEPAVPEAEFWDKPSGHRRRCSITHILIWWLPTTAIGSHRTSQQEVVASSSAESGPLLVSDLFALGSGDSATSLGRIQLTIPLRVWLDHDGGGSASGAAAPGGISPAIEAELASRCRALLSTASFSQQTEILVAYRPNLRRRRC